MQPTDSPFTDIAQFAELPYETDGTFSWVADTPTHNEDTIGRDYEKELPDQLKTVITSANQHKVSLPLEFDRFIRTKEWHKHVRSHDACYLNLARSVLPFAGGFLLRFLHDQQEAAFWYLYLNADGSEHCVVSSLEYFDAEEMDYETEDLESSDFQFCESSFERFILKFWVDNEQRYSNRANKVPSKASQTTADLVAEVLAKIDESKRDENGYLYHTFKFPSQIVGDAEEMEAFIRMLCMKGWVYHSEWGYLRIVTMFNYSK